MSKRRTSGDGLIRKRSDGRWEGRIVVGHRDDGYPIYRSVFAKTQRELMPKLHQLKEYYAGMELIEHSKITLGEWLDRWLTEIKEPMLRESTVVGYRRYIENQIKPYLGNKTITSVSSTDIQRLYNKLKREGRIAAREKNGEGLANATVRSVHMLLHEAMDGAVKEGLIPFNPTEATTIPKNEKTEKTILLESQIETFMQALEGDEIWHDFFYTAIMTGMRRGEICGLKWTDFDEEHGTLHIQRSVRYARGIYIVGETKTNEGNRKIVLPTSVAELLKERRKKALTEWIFPKPYYPEHPMIPEAAYTQLKKLLKKAGLPDMRFHDLRHTFATHAASNGIDPKTLAGILGHTKASFTLDRYTHVTTDMQRQASGIVGNFITDMFGEELKPWQDEENQAKAQ